MKFKPRILICGILPPPYFGHSMMYKMLMESEFIKTYDVTFMNMHFWTYGTHKKVTIAKLWKMARYVFQYIYLILRHRPQYVLYNMSFDKMPFLKDYLFCRLGKLLGCKIVIHDMGQYVQELYDNGSDFYKRLVKKFCAMATASIVLGEGTKDKYEGFMDRKKLVSVPGCVTDFYDEGVRKEKSREYVRVLYFSFLSRTKGVMTAIKAIPEVIKHNKNVRFTFGGPIESDELKNEIDVFITKNQLKEYVEFLGYVDSEEKRTELMRQSDIFIFPTLRDVFGLVLLHAMAEGLAVVASIEGTIPEIVQDGKTGVLFSKGDEFKLVENILMLAKDQDLREKMGHNGRQRYLEMFTLEVYGQNMIKAFNQIIKL
ncbi:hypothetical protein MNBD_UNCLBAC01-504 [hydrothermal vent metagenome]|uniref:Glycosyl transferase family 1 domain-containing protein n=1 Tax=hydrothermal vent metagenome TaxID=652676 RepID=A0A3B1D0Q6_9ZZZZ